MRRSHPIVESLEDRRVLSTLFVEPVSYPIDGSHFHTLQDALGAAAANDVIMIEQGATVSSFGSTLARANGVSTLTAATLPNDTVVIANNYVSPGEEIRIGTGATADSNLVLAASPVVGGLEYVLTLKAPLANPHAAGERIDTDGQLGIGKTVTIAGDVGQGPATISSNLVVWGITQGVTLQNLVFGAGVELRGGSSGTTIRISTLSSLTEDAGGVNSGANVIRESIVTGAVTLTGNNTNTTTADQILNNQFRGGSLSLNHDDGATVQGNTFDLSTGATSAITVTDSQNVVISNNILTIVNPVAAPPGIGPASAITLLNTAGTTNPLFATLLNNQFNTSGLGRGVLLSPSAGNGSNFRVSLQGNDFHFDQIGVEDTGDGSASQNAAGIVDAGGGPLGSLGANDFHGFLMSDATAGNRFAIYLHGTTGASGVLSARNNIWTTGDPTQVVKDSSNNTAAGVPPLAAGSGIIDVGAPTLQLTPDQQYVQSLFLHFLGRAGNADELNTWVTQLPNLGATGVANAIIRTSEALTRLVDSFYIKFLNRTADPDGETFWVNQLANGVSQETVMAGFLGSDEYFTRLDSSAAGPDVAYVRSLYQRLLGRGGSNTEISFWVSRSASLGRVGVAANILQSNEYRLDAVVQYYYNLLHRPIGPSLDEANLWVNSAAPLLALKADFAGTLEYMRNG